MKINTLARTHTHINKMMGQVFIACLVNLKSFGIINVSLISVKFEMFNSQ